MPGEDLLKQRPVSNAGIEQRGAIMWDIIISLPASEDFYIDLSRGREPLGLGIR
jgi:hypothetical protein